MTYIIFLLWYPRIKHKFRGNQRRDPAHLGRGGEVLGHCQAFFKLLAASSHSITGGLR